MLQEPILSIWNILIAGALVIACISVFFVVRHQRRKARETAVMAPVCDLLKRFSSLHNKCIILDSHSANYFVSLNSAGLSELLEIRNHLSIAIDDCHEMIRNGQYNEARELLSFLLSGSGPYESVDSLVALRYPLLVNWEHESDRLILDCIRSMGEQSEENNRIGLERPGKRRRTCHSLDELRQRVLN